MDNLNVSLANYIKQSRICSQSGDFVGAKTQLLHACECVLLLAKKSVGKEKESYLSTFATLKASIANIDAKINEKNTFSPVAPVNETPQTPETNTASSISSTQSSSRPSTPANVPYKTDKSSAQTGQFTGSLSPKWLSDYIGQPQAVTAVKDLIDAALLRDSALPHIILYGSHGLGKTTFSKIIANEMRANFIEVNVTNITPDGMIAILKNLKPKDILFIDEIHTLPLQVAEAIMYSAMQDGRVTYTEGKGKTSRTETLVLPPFTLIGATTEIGKIAKPFTHRAIQVRLEEYTDEVLAGIIKASFYKLCMKIDDELALKISKRCRNNPRTANNTVKRISDKALVRYAQMNNIKDRGVFSSPENIKKLSIYITEKVIDEFFEENGIDEYGLEKGDRELLRIIITRYGGGPVGVDTLARVMNEANNVITQKYEAYLIKKGMLKIEPQGRVVMAQGYRVLNMPVPKSVLDQEKEVKGSIETEQPKSKYEKRKIIASKVQDEIKCKKIEDLIVYPDNATEVFVPLDDLFPDVEKPYEAETKHQCELEIDFDDKKRLIICDSFLESRFATALASTGFLRDMKAQTLEIPYISQQLANRRYFPDFVIQDYKGRVAIIEMKNFDTACYHLNIDKYEKLAEYCKQNGYGYAEIMRAYNADEYISIDSLYNRPVNKQLENFILESIENNGKNGEAVFTEKDWKEYNAKYGQVEKTEIYTVLLNNRLLRNIDRLGTELKITLN
ncbi:MAG: AAA family ATPase [Clostridia bacterium]|nr:AAA family ATPase [Clostridia bacterium]